MINKGSFLFFFLAVITSSCKKINPKPTQTGSDTVWFRLNGEEHKYVGKPNAINGWGTYVIYPYPDSNSKVGFDMTGIANSHGDYDDRITIFSWLPSSGPALNTAYRIVNWVYNDYSFYYYSKLSGSNYNVDTARSFITFTRFDNNVIAGKFIFYGYDLSNNKVAITESYFDIAREH